MQATKVFQEIPGDGVFPILSHMPILMQESVARLKAISSVTKINGSIAGNVVKLVVFLRPGNAHVQHGQFMAAFDKENLRIKRMKFGGDRHRILFHIHPAKHLAC